MSDKALVHAVYISKIAGSQIDTLYVIERIKEFFQVYFLHFCSLL